MYWKQRSKTESEKLFDAVCTETFLIEIGKDNAGYYMFEKHLSGDDLPAGKQFIERLAKRDGFDDDIKINMNFKTWGKTAAEKMFEWFDKHYDLSEPKIFQVIRWLREAIVE